MLARVYQESGGDSPRLWMGSPGRFDGVSVSFSPIRSSSVVMGRPMVFRWNMVVGRDVSSSVM